MSKLTDAVSRFDAAGWHNEITGFGTRRDKTTHTHFDGYQLLQPQELSALYHGDDIAAVAVDVVPDEMLREGFSVELGDKELNKAVTAVLDELDVRDRYADGIRWGRLFGGGAVLVGADDGRPASLPLEPALAESVRYLYAVDRRYLWPLTWYTDVGNPKLGQVETYLVVPSAGVVTASPLIVVHESRLIVFGGAKTASLERQMNAGWDHSILQRVYEVIAAFATGFKAVEIMLTDGNQAVFKMQGLAALLGSGGEVALRKRIAAIDLYRSALRAMVVDAGDPDTKGGEESFERQSVSFEQIPATLDKFMLRLSAALRIPVTILMGQSPAGMNATGESDFRWFYDRIRSEQNIKLAPRIRQLVRIILATKSMGGKTVENVEIKFPPLWTEPASVVATRKKTIADMDVAYVNAGVFTPEEIALTRGQSEGWDRDVQLTPEGVDARQAVLDVDIEDMENPDQGATDDEEPGVPPLPPAIPAPPKPGDEVTRTDAADDALFGALGSCSRAFIVGGPRTGKSTLAARAGERLGRKVLATDSVIGTTSPTENAWSAASTKVAGWVDDEEPYLLEGVAVPRALRKWLGENPGKRLEGTAVVLRRPQVARTQEQRAMSKGVMRVWDSIKGELATRGVRVVERDT